MMRFIMWCHTLGRWRRIFTAMVTCSSPVFSSLTLGHLTTHSPLTLEGLFWGWKCASKPNFGADFLELSQDFKSLAWSDPSPRVLSKQMETWQLYMGEYKVWSSGTGDSFIDMILVLIFNRGQQRPVAPTGRLGSWDIHWQIWQDFLVWLAKGSGMQCEGVSESPK